MTGIFASRRLNMLFSAAAILLSGTSVEAASSAPQNAVPPFAFVDGGWQAVGVVLLAPPSGPGPVMDMPGRKRIGNNLDLGQPIFAMADLSNPILQPWARDALKKVNDYVAAGGGGFTAQASCKLVGVPAFLLHPAQPIYFIQTPNEVVWHAAQRYRRVEQGPIRESSCAEAPVNYLHYDMDPIPQAGKADF